MDPNPQVICPYCGNPAVRCKSYGKWFWECAPCDARVGTHKRSTPRKRRGGRVVIAHVTPLGSLAKPALRRMRSDVHGLFDRLWQGDAKEMTRTEAYAWLADAMKLPEERAHIGMFDESQCARALVKLMTRAPRTRQSFEDVGDYPDPPEFRYDLSDNVR